MSHVAAWCGGMALTFALVHWRDGQPWRADAVSALIGMAAAFAWSLPA